MTKFYTFRQNSADGPFEVDDVAGISVNVIIEAENFEHANKRAVEIGLHFDSDRWYAQWDDSDGDEVPSDYGKQVYANDLSKTLSTSDKWVEGPEGYVHCLDGTISPFGL